MYRYVVLIWDFDRAQSQAVAEDLQERLQLGSRGWECATRAPGLAVMHAGQRSPSSVTTLLSEDAGAVLGRLFDGEGRAVRAALSNEETRKVVSSGGTRLLQQYWGRYVSVVRDATVGSVCVMRDPSGTMPCFLTTFRDVTLAFSDIEDCVALRVMRFTVNWGYVAAFVPHPSLQIRNTGLNEVSELQPGERARIHCGVIERSQVWNPFDIAKTSAVRDHDEAVLALYRTVRRCIHAWASVHPVILHNLSGGLDSSIVLSCLSDAPSRSALTCINYFSGGRNEDERKYARLAATESRAELIEQPLNFETVALEKLFEVRRSPRPWFYIYDLEHGPLETQLAAQRGITGIFSGSGGDALFFQSRADLAVADHLFDRPFSPALPRVALDAARVARVSMWPLLRAAVAQRLVRRRWTPHAEAGRARSLIRAEAIDAARANGKLQHPWFERANGALPGVLWKVASLSVPPAFYDSFDHETLPERVVPLMSQPLIELCLRIPTYTAIAGGFDRSVARHAFAGDVPKEIIRRRAKGSVGRHTTSVLDANLSLIRETLLDGKLVREGLLDRERLELYLSRETSPGDFEYHEILHQHLCTEVWLQRWH